MSKRIMIIDGGLRKRSSYARLLRKGRKNFNLGQLYESFNMANKILNA